MRFFSSKLSCQTPTGNGLISQEIDDALHLHIRQKHHQPHGLIIGLEKFRKLKEQARARKAEISGYYNGMPIIIDATEQFRIAVF